MKWIEVKIKTSHEAVESMSNILHESGAGGVVIEDPQDVIVFQNETENWDYIDERLLGALEENVCVKGYLSESPNLSDNIQLIKERVEQVRDAGIDAGLGEVTIAEVFEEDWSSAWKQYYKPLKIGKNIVIKPSWEKYEGKEWEHIIELDPGMAFGTGTHETTQLCIQLLERYVKEDDIVIDIGSGTGILGIVAAKLKSKRVIGVDIDPIAIKVAKENILINNVEDIFEIREGHLFDQIKEKGDIVVANIVTDVILDLIKDIRRNLNEQGILIASGIILDRLEDVKSALEEEKIEILSIEKMGEWVALCCRV
ncbi:MAG TPA: 50S ribosomal protein L11 methyltransferase [Eubacteriaceae bacterium]|jgi:ribosomal protein L11 methyltransferase|nr:50S ribosomal protein L11 methyltransferase [Eubacteriaceae bacterium]